MLYLFLLIPAALLIFTLVQSITGVIYLQTLWRKPKPPMDDQTCPKVAVVLCLRGHDPFLFDCILAILKQDYPSFDFHVVIDHENDPARKILDEVLKEHPSENVYVQYLTDRKDSCSLKCSSLIQVVSSLDSSYDVMAQLDADTVTHPMWLKELVQPLLDPDVGATSGNRWYIPEKMTWGTTVRWLWNAGAVPQMFWYNMPWGGTLAIKMDVIRNSNLLEHWSSAFGDDTMLASFLHKNKQKLVFVPSLIMANRESCGLNDLTGWVSRQLFSARINHVNWPIVLGQALFSMGLMVLTFCLAIYGLVTEQWLVAAVNAIAFGLFQASNFALIWQLETAATNVVKRRGEPSRAFSLMEILRMPMALALTHTVFLVALVRATFTRSVTWRGAVYRTTGKKKIKLIEDHPYVSHQAGHETLL